ncbi:hypothetical protein HK097_010921 [Rhizophlyctis rosea]|uniref:Uncharacterized protein n=1 Tax=Rhizophlyctis rosea TaxID=64517 RepID=A0AAD5S9P6_9FUNG|nr:hypothetical protein HK097_010921 [Rhizophlyctis rosea]
MGMGRLSDVVQPGKEIMSDQDGERELQEFDDGIIVDEQQTAFIGAIDAAVTAEAAPLFRVPVDGPAVLIAPVLSNESNNGTNCPTHPLPTSGIRHGQEYASSRLRMFQQSEEEVQKTRDSIAAVAGRRLSPATAAIINNTRQLLAGFLVNQHQADVRSPLETAVIGDPRESLKYFAGVLYGAKYEDGGRIYVYHGAVTHVVNAYIVMRRDVKSFYQHGEPLMKAARREALAVLADYRAADPDFALEPLVKRPIDPATALVMFDEIDQRIRASPLRSKTAFLRSKIALVILQHFGVRPSSSAVRSEFDITRHVLTWDGIELRLDAVGFITGQVKFRSMKGKHWKNPHFSEKKTFSYVNDLRLDLGAAILAWGCHLGVFQAGDVDDVMRTGVFVVKPDWQSRPLLCCLRSDRSVEPDSPMSTHSYLEMVKNAANDIGINPLEVSPKSFRRAMADMAGSFSHEAAQTALNHRRGSAITDLHYSSGARTMDYGALQRGENPFMDTQGHYLLLDRAPRPCPAPNAAQLREFRQKDRQYAELMAMCAKAGLDALLGADENDVPVEEYEGQECGGIEAQGEDQSLSKVLPNTSDGKEAHYRKIRKAFLSRTLREAQRKLYTDYYVEQIQLNYEDPSRIPAATELGIYPDGTFLTSSWRLEGAENVPPAMDIRLRNGDLLVGYVKGLLHTASDALAQRRGNLRAAAVQKDGSWTVACDYQGCEFVTKGAKTQQACIKMMSVHKSKVHVKAFTCPVEDCSFM